LAVVNSQNDPDQTGDVTISTALTNVDGFVYVSDVDEVKSRITLLNPCPGRLNCSFLLVGTVKWVEK
jgi:polyribonucleotide 5'-hydroxyl-kinase